MIEAVLFDMDGVIFDTERINAKGWKKVAARYQIALTDNNGRVFAQSKRNSCRSI